MEHIDNRFISLFRSEPADELERAEDDGIQTGMIGSFPVFCRGVLPEAKGVLIVSFVSTERIIRDIYASALEAALSGVDIISIGDRGGMLSVIQGAEDGGGRVHMVISEGMRSYEREYGWKLRRILLSGGSVISPLLWGRNEEAAKCIALSISSSMVAAAGGKRLKSSHAIIQALDAGLDVSILRSSLTEESMRTIAREGCPVVCSYSSSIALPRAIAYPSEDGSYGFHGSRFGIMRMQWD